jgi:hypothetical protein
VEREPTVMGIMSLNTGSHMMIHLNWSGVTELPCLFILVCMMFLSWYLSRKSISKIFYLGPPIPYFSRGEISGLYPNRKVNLLYYNIHIKSNISQALFSFIYPSFSPLMVFSVSITVSELNQTSFILISYPFPLCHTTIYEGKAI